MFKSILTPEHDKYIRDQLDITKESAKEINKLISNINIGGLKRSTSDVYAKILNLSEEKISKNNEILNDYINDIRNLKNQTSDHENSGGANPSQYPLANFQKILDVVISNLIKLNYLTELKIKDGEILHLDETISSLKQEAATIQNGVSTLQQTYPSLSKTITDELNKSTVLYTSFEDLVKNKTKAINDLTSLVAAERLTKDYLEKANTEKVQADIFRGYAIAALLTTSALLALTFILYLTSVVASSLPIELTLGKQFKPIAMSNSILLLAFILLIPAAYFARESQNHRKLELMNLRTSQDLSAVVNFISSLPEDEQVMIKTLLAVNMISNKHEYESDEKSPVFVQEYLLKLLDKKIISKEL